MEKNKKIKNPIILPTLNNFESFEEVQKLSKSWNPLPEKGKTLKSSVSVEKHSNFINCSQGYFNKGKHKGIMVKNVDKNYLTWVFTNIKLNECENKLLKKYLVV